MVELRRDMMRKSGIKGSKNLKNGKILMLQASYSTKNEAVKIAKSIRKGGDWHARVVPTKYKGSGKYSGKIVYSVYGRIRMQMTPK